MDWGQGLFLERELWEDDGARADCSLCRKGFTVSRRRHHCRMCGFLYCHACSDQRILGQRVCSKCCDLMLRTYVGNNTSPARRSEGEGGAMAVNGEARVILGRLLVDCYGREGSHVR
jgi:hypothetical protein